LREAVRASDEEPIPRPLLLYVHVPCRMGPCFYCGCNRVITRDIGKPTATWKASTMRSS
jgi:oxygen-independent coproporphyrinogen-3 oxidase